MQEELKPESPDVRLEPIEPFTGTPYSFDGYAYGQGLASVTTSCPYRPEAWEYKSWWAGRDARNDLKPYRIRGGWK